MKIDRELLWKAWPDGCLAMRGASTVGGWICMGEGNEGLKWSHSDPRVRADPPPQWARCFDGERTAGDLLPNVDPADTATWACLLQELVQAIGVPPEDRTHAFGYQWSHDQGAGMWTLDCGWQSGLSFELDTDDPSEALVRARIQVRELEGR